MSVRNGRRNALALCAAIICASATGIARAQPLANPRLVSVAKCILALKIAGFLRFFVGFCLILSCV
jgi:hypothetical protein